MARIDPELFAKIKARSGLERAQVYKRITTKSGELMVPAHAAAVAVARDLGISVSKYHDELEMLRGHNRTAPATAAPVPSGRGKAVRAPKRQTRRTDGKTVFVVHGRDHKVRSALFQ